MATSERTRQIASSLRHREVHGYMSGHHSLGLREDFFHQQVIIIIISNIFI